MAAAWDHDLTKLALSGRATQDNVTSMLGVYPQSCVNNAEGYLQCEWVIDRGVVPLQAIGSNVAYGTVRKYFHALCLFNNGTLFVCRSDWEWPPTLNQYQE
jgi:hypothetical protein